MVRQLAFPASRPRPSFMGVGEGGGGCGEGTGLLELQQGGQGSQRGPGCYASPMQA